MRKEDPIKAIELFDKVVRLESELGDEVKWRFKALQISVTIYFRLKEFEKMVTTYRSMLQYLSSVTRNECTDAINSILDALNTAR